MRFQSNQSSCGLACISNALLCLGIKRSEDELAPLAGFTAADGTSAKGILRALSTVAKSESGTQVRPYVLHESREDVAILRLVEILRRGSPAILSVDDGEHWVLAFGLLGDRIHISDPADTELVLHYRPTELAARWRATGRRPFYAILL